MPAGRRFLPSEELLGRLSSVDTERSQRHGRGAAIDRQDDPRHEFRSIAREKCRSFGDVSEAPDSSDLSLGTPKAEAMTDVMTPPAPIAFERMPRGPSSATAGLTTPITACLIFPQAPRYAKKPAGLESAGSFTGYRAELLDRGSRGIRLGSCLLVMMMLCMLRRLRRFCLLFGHRRGGGRSNRSSSLGRKRRWGTGTGLCK